MLLGLTGCSVRSNNPDCGKGTHNLGGSEYSLFQLSYNNTNNRAGSWKMSLSSLWGMRGGKRMEQWGAI